MYVRYGAEPLLWSVLHVHAACVTVGSALCHTLHDSYIIALAFMRLKIAHVSRKYNLNCNFVTFHSCRTLFATRCTLLHGVACEWHTTLAACLSHIPYSRIHVSTCT